MNMHEIKEGVTNAGFCIRFLAFMFDGLFIAAIVFLLTYLLKGGWDKHFFESLCGLVSLVFQIGFLSAFSATPGKLLFGLKVVVADSGQSLALGRIILRWIGYGISGCFPVGFIWVAIDKEKRGFHDYIAGTRVIYSNQ